MVRLLAVVAVIAGLLYASGVLKINLAFNVPGLKGEQAAATAFWQERTTEEQLTRRVAGTPPGTRVTLSVVTATGPRSVNTALLELKDQR